MVQRTTADIVVDNDEVKIKAAYDRATNAEVIWEALSGDPAPVVLLSAKWLIAWSKGGRRLPRRQELPAEAFLSLAELQRIRENRAQVDLDPSDHWEKRTMPIVVISYCWLTAQHPDPDGIQLKLIVALLEEQFVRCRGCPGYGGVYEDMGIFWDWCSLFQKDAAGQRTKAEWDCFNRAIRTMGLWYAHPMTVVYLITKRVQEGIDYSKRGWTLFERSLTNLVKPSTAGGYYDGWSMCIDLGQDRNKDGLMSFGGQVPLVPALFAEALQKRAFTSRGDKAVVAKLYTTSALPLLRGHEKVILGGVSLGAGSGARLAAALAYCRSMKVLWLSNCGLDDAELAVLAPALPRCTAMQELILGNNKFTEAASLAKVLPKCTALNRLALLSSHLDEASRSALRAAARGTKIQIFF